MGDMSHARLMNDIWYDVSSLSSLRSQGYQGWEYFQPPELQTGG
jgi:hypothetical protein